MVSGPCHEQWKSVCRLSFVVEHQENGRVTFGVFIFGNRIFGDYVFVIKVFQDLCLWMLIFDISHDPFRSLSQQVGLSYFEVFGCEN